MVTKKKRKLREKIQLFDEIIKFDKKSIRINFFPNFMMSSNYRKMAFFNEGIQNPRNVPKTLSNLKILWFKSYPFKCRKVFSNSLTLCQDIALQICRKKVTFLFKVDIST